MAEFEINNNRTLLAYTKGKYVPYDVCHRLCMVINVARALPRVSEWEACTRWLDVDKNGFADLTKGWRLKIIVHKYHLEFLEMVYKKPRIIN